MKILFAVGGGGHFSPALAVLEALPKDTEVLVVGRKYTFEGDSALSLEYQTLKKYEIPFEPIITGRLQRRLTRHTLFSLVKTPIGLYQSLKIIKKFKPDVIISFGGYVAFPVTLAAYILRVPLVLHEQTLGAGLANKLAAPFAKKICISFETSQKYFPRSKTVLTGNPVKNFPISNFQFPISNEKLPLILVAGGSSGSHSINVLIEGCLSRLLERYRVIHQTGDAKEFGDFERLSNLKSSLSKKLQERYVLTKFIDPKDFGSVLQKEDLVISRAGINTVCDLLNFEKMSLLIPLPYSQNNEQLENARFLEKLGLAEILLQNQTTSDSLFNQIEAVIRNKQKYQLSEESKRYIVKDATERVIEVIYSIKT